MGWIGDIRAFYETNLSNDRKTGVTLRDTGVRDEHGMELLDDIFSSSANSSSDEEKEEEDSIEVDENDDSDDDDSGDVPMDLTTGR